MKQKEITHTFMMISNFKKIFVFVKINVLMVRLIDCINVLYIIFE